MKRFTAWLETSWARAKSLFAADQAGDPEDVEPDDEDRDETAETGEMPNIYADVKRTNPHMKVVEAVKADSDDTRGFNPYDTGTLQRKGDD